MQVRQILQRQSGVVSVEDVNYKDAQAEVWVAEGWGFDEHGVQDVLAAEGYLWTAEERAYRAKEAAQGDAEDNAIHGGQERDFRF